MQFFSWYDRILVLNTNAEGKMHSAELRESMRSNISVDKSFSFAVQIVNLYKFLVEERKEYVLSKQLLRSGTSIGANVSEAQRGQSKADFISKMSIALKEANETNYWLRLLYTTEYITKPQYDKAINDVNELISILIAICKTSNSNK